MNFALNLLASSFNAGSILMIVILVVLVVLLILGYMKRRKFNTQLTEMRSNLKVGEKVMTDTGVIGEIVDKRTVEDQEYITLKTGTKDHFGFIEVHANAIYYSFDKNSEAHFATKPEEDTTANTEEKTTDKK